VLHAPAALAAPADPYGERTPLDLPAEGRDVAASGIGSAGGGGSLLRTVVGLVVVVGVIYGVAWVLRQMRAAGQERSSGTGLRSEAVIALGPNRSVHLIRAGRELVLVGCAESGVVPIRTYSEDEARRLGLWTDGTPGDAADGPVVPSPAGLLDALRRRTAR
jgi:flagellar protein FliO/FliZ